MQVVWRYRSARGASLLERGLLRYRSARGASLLERGLLRYRSARGASLLERRLKPRLRVQSVAGEAGGAPGVRPEFFDFTVSAKDRRSARDV